MMDSVRLIKQHHSKMAKLKFIDNCQVEENVFVRNGVWEYIDKYETYLPISCDNDCARFVFMYKIQVDQLNKVLTVSGDYIAEIDGVINKDYTKEEWNAFITKDYLVEDGDYVKAWKETFNINDPVKDVTDQCDYNPAWKRLQVQIDKEYGNGGFETDT